MKLAALLRPSALSNRLALYVGALVTLIWIVAAFVTVHIAVGALNTVFDSELQTTAERILPIVLHEREEAEDDRIEIHPDDRGHRPPRAVEDDVEFLVTKGDKVLLRSDDAAEMTFPTRPGFSEDRTWRYYVEVSRRGDSTIAVARPIAARRALEGKAMLLLSLPLIVVIPLTLFGITYLVRRGLRPIVLLSRSLSTRGPANLAPVPATGLPDELTPVVDSANRLLGRVEAGFEAERSFAANAAHEMRTPVAGAIAQAQRLQAETSDPAAAARAAEIEATLKRLNRYNEKLMQLARAEGARLRGAEPVDLVPVARIVCMDLARQHGEARVALSLPATPVMSDLDPDAFGIVLRNLVENGLTHGDPAAPVEVQLAATAHNGPVLTVTSQGPAIPPEVLARIGERFQRGGKAGNGTGLGLSILHVIAERSGAVFTLTSPIPDRDSGTQAHFTF